MNETIALGAAALMGSLVVGALLSRWLIAPTGSHRPPHLAEDAAPLTLARPGGAEVTDWGHCPAEDRQTLHEYHPDDSRTCWTCRTHTPGARR
ncbi:hypothetical protein ACF06Q_09425 [Streptomyces leeuwenhoekii]|uniref:hypothetical protein n=1 Tax=Streptomyces leeuwenhoekii TaxID=1437453 RepID=UPI003701F3ED